MTKVKITLSIDEEIAKTLRTRAMEKYGNSRSMSLLVEDLVNGAQMPEEPTTCKLLLGKDDKFAKEQFDRCVEELTATFKDIPMPAWNPETEVKRESFLCDDDGNPIYHWSGGIRGADEYYVVKAVMERHLNKLAIGLNGCCSCHGLSSPVPTYPENHFEQYILIHH